jgi:hypothetical protein
VPDGIAATASYDADPADVTILVDDPIDRNALFYDDSDVRVVLDDIDITG